MEKAFDSSKESHRKSFMKMINLIHNETKDIPPTYLVIPKKLYKKIKKISSKNSYLKK